MVVTCQGRGDGGLPGGPTGVGSPLTVLVGAEPHQRRTGSGASGMVGQGRHRVLWASQAVLGCFRRK